MFVSALKKILIFIDGISQGHRFSLYFHSTKAKGNSDWRKPETKNVRM